MWLNCCRSKFAEDRRPRLRNVTHGSPARALVADYRELHLHQTHGIAGIVDSRDVGREAAEGGIRSTVVKSTTASAATRERIGQLRLRYGGNRAPERRTHEFVQQVQSAACASRRGRTRSVLNLVSKAKVNHLDSLPPQEVPY